MDDEDIAILRFYLTVASWNAIEDKEKLIPYEQAQELNADAREKLNKRKNLGLPNNDYSTLAAKEFDSLLDGHIHRAKLGTTADAKAILKEFCACVRNNTDSKGKPFRRSSGIGDGVVTNTQIDERIIRYLAECFEKILKIEETKNAKKGDKPMKVYDALHLKSDTRQADPDRKKKEIIIANEVRDLITSGEELEIAFGIVARKHYPDGGEDDKGSSAVRAAHHKYNIELQAARISKQIEKQKNESQFKGIPSD